jgi:hypothetical protein
LANGLISLHPNNFMCQFPSNNYLITRGLDKYFILESNKTVFWVLFVWQNFHKTNQCWCYQLLIVMRFYRPQYLIGGRNNVPSKASTVKSVYNNHPWDLRNVVIMLRVVWKRSVASKLWVGCYGFKLAVDDRWLLFGGGC